MKLLYKPFGLIAGILGGIAGKKTYKAIWSGVSDEPAPKPGEPEASLVQVVLSAALKGATLAGVGAAFKVLSARAFHHLIGAWPEKPAKAEED
ncbi:MAG TPA: DUF4235 domain-containing protein [Solirubrobacteraceae bacterium]|nr:DUF4235 domain-containing protein [Solirubrobacteraceae bacterium]